MIDPLDFHLLISLLHLIKITILFILISKTKDTTFIDKTMYIFFLLNYTSHSN